MPKRRYTTGNPKIDDLVDALVNEAGGDSQGELISQIVTTGLLFASDNASRLDVKIANAALKEMRYAFKIFAPYRDTPKVSVFGSARTSEGHPDFEQARQFGKQIADRGWMVVTGAGPGTMEGANAGAGKAASFGVNIRLPFEAEPNQFIAEDPKLINFKYFFTRKLMFIKEAEAFVLLPGGFGTMDEAFELLTLMQTGKSDIHPIVLLDSVGGSYWQRWLEFVDDTLVKGGYVSDTDFNLLIRTDSVDEAVEEVCHFYRTYHSMRYVRDRLILRLKRRISDDDLALISNEFEDVLAGPIERTEPSSGEVADSDVVDLERIALNFDRTHFGRLRALIDRLNDL